MIFPFPVPLMAEAAAKATSTVLEWFAGGVVVGGAGVGGWWWFSTPKVKLSEAHQAALLAQGQLTSERISSTRTMVESLCTSINGLGSALNTTTTEAKLSTTHLQALVEQISQTILQLGDVMQLEKESSTTFAEAIPALAQISIDTQAIGQSAIASLGQLNTLLCNKEVDLNQTRAGIAAMNTTLTQLAAALNAIEELKIQNATQQQMIENQDQEIQQLETVLERTSMQMKFFKQAALSRDGQPALMSSNNQSTGSDNEISGYEH